MENMRLRECPNFVYSCFTQEKSCRPECRKVVNLFFVKYKYRQNLQFLQAHIFRNLQAEYFTNKLSNSLILRFFFSGGI